MFAARIVAVGLFTVCFACPAPAADPITPSELATLCRQVIDEDDEDAQVAALKLTDRAPNIAKHIITIRFGANRSRKLQACYLLPRLTPKPVGVEIVLVWYARSAPKIEKGYTGETTSAALQAAAEINPESKDVIEAVRQLVDYEHKQRPVMLRVRRGALGAYHTILEQNEGARAAALEFLKDRTEDSQTLQAVVVALGRCGADAKPTLRKLLLNADAEVRRLADLQIKAIERGK